MKNFDFVVVGGGIAGCSLSYELARQGRSVALIERGRLGRATSAMNQGGIRQQFFQTHNIRAGVETVRRVGQFATEFGVDPDFRQNGYLLLLTHAESVANFEKAVKLQVELGVPTRMMPARDIKSIVPRLKTTDLRAACYCPTDGYCDPDKLMQGFSRGARKAGVSIFETTDIIALEGNDHRIDTVCTTAGTFGAGLVVNAAGPWSPEVARFVGGTLPVFAHQTSVFMFRPQHTEYAKLPLVIDIDHRVTLCPHPEGLMVGDARKPRVNHPGLSPSFDWTRLPDVRQRAASRLEDLATAPVGRAFAGYWEVTPDDDPLIDFCFRDNFYVFTGFSGHGISIVPGLAPSVAQELLGQEPDISLAPFRVARFSSPGASKTEIWGGTAVANAEHSPID